MLKLIAAWMAMGFRRPEITWGKTVRGRSKPRYICVCGQVHTGVPHMAIKQYAFVGFFISHSNKPCRRFAR
jgi:hypothetical protein